MASNDKTLDLAITQIEKQYGKGSIMKLNEEVVVECNGISTGSISLDAAVGIGGVPRGRIVEIYGPESSGKTTLTLHIIAQAQKNNGVAAFIDTEHAFDPSYAKKLGVDFESLYFSQPDETIPINLPLLSVTADPDEPITNFLFNPNISIDEFKILKYLDLTIFILPVKASLYFTNAFLPFKFECELELNAFPYDLSNLKTITSKNLL